MLMFLATPSCRQMVEVAPVVLPLLPLAGEDQMNQDEIKGKTEAIKGKV